MPGREQTILHVDMDAFFAAVEQRDHPEWQGKPVIVGAGPHERGVVSTCSYEARKFGVHSAMPSQVAYRRCPQGIFVKPRMKVYQAVSARVFEIFSHYTPFIEAVSVDEAFLDVTGSWHLFGSPRELAERLRAEVKATCSLTCSAGIGPNRLLAKIASEQRKPDGLFEMPRDPEAIREFLAPRDVQILWGVGRKTADILRQHGFRTCGDLQRADARFLTHILGSAAASSIRNHALGIDFSDLDAEGAAEKSVSREHTFLQDETDRNAVRDELIALVAEVGRRFRTLPRWAKVAKIKLRNADFQASTRQAAFEFAARDDITFRHQALALFDEEWPEGAARTVRLVGFGVTNIVDRPDEPEPDLFGPDPKLARRLKRERLAEALDNIAKFQKR